MPEQVAGKAGEAFERRVAALYRVLGAEVEHNVAVAGSQVDVRVRERTSSGTMITRIVECKEYSTPVGVGVVRSFASLVDLLKGRGLTDVATIVATSGYTQQARQAANDFHIELLEIADLERKVRGAASAVKEAEDALLAEDEEMPAEQAPALAFVIMPFIPDLEDVYLLGFRDVAESLGIVVERADEITHNDLVINVIQEKLRGCDVVIAETSHANPNVYYELGYAHGVNKPVIITAKAGSEIPFDIQGINHILYDNIVDLKSKLSRRLQAMDFIDVTHIA